jgi:hypothetical protein
LKSKFPVVIIFRYVKDINDIKDIPLFVVSLLSNAYELNSWLPNTHLVFYNMFCSPKINKSEREESEKLDLLSGNIFKTSVSPIGYKSLLHSVLIKGKKKHFKKILQHMNTYLKAEEIDDEIVGKVIGIAEAYSYPILLGKTMKEFTDMGVVISKENYVSFCMYLDMCKGLENDTLRFVFDVNRTEHIQLDWDFVRPLVIRAINYRSGGEVLEMFERIKNKLSLNVTNQKLPQAEQEALLDKIKSDFYREFINVLLDKKGFDVADIIYTDYRNQLTMQNPNDMLGMRIGALKDKIDLFEKHLNEVLSVKGTENSK